MKLIHGIATAFICLVLLGTSLAGAEQTEKSYDDLFGDSLSSLFSGEDGTFNLASLFSEEVITGIITFILAFFMSLFGISLS